MFSNRAFPAAALFVSAWLIASPAAAQQVVPRILNGTPTDEFPSVGIVGSEQLGGFCSGTLISPSHVLTAAHCAEIIEGPTAGTFELTSGIYTTQAIFIHPDFDPVTLENDIAILELSSSAAEEPSPVFGGIKPDGFPLEGGELLTIVGFGGGGDSGGSDGTFGVKMVGMVMIDFVTDTQILWTFDDPSESNTAPGDSGGPGFLDVEGELMIASITSGGSLPDAGLGDMAFNTRVDAFLSWIDMVLESMPTEPGEEGDEGDGSLCPGIDFELLHAELQDVFAVLKPILSAIANWFDGIREFRQGRAPGLRSFGQKFGFGKRGGRRAGARL